jgi:basic membrane lipoprotein Med (substrate-binding protein (PBP1-ABC) superfamily)
MKIRKLILVVTALSLSVAACGTPAATTPASVAPGPASPAASSGSESAAPSAAKLFRVALLMPSSTTDLAFSQSMYQALVAMQSNAGGEANFEIKFTENMFSVPDAQAAIRDYASQGFDLVVAHGSQYGAGVEEIAKDFPAVSFAWGTDVNTFGLPNVYAYTAAAEQGGFVNGVLAATLSKSRTIGVTGPVEVGDAKTYISGFSQGVAAIDPTITISKTWTGSFSDVAAMTEAAKAHITAGADVLTGSSQSVVGSIGAAKEAGNVLWFGTQADQASLATDLVVASQVYDWTVILDDMIPKIQSGTLGGETYTLELSNGGLKIAFNPGYTLAAEAKAAAEKAIADITSGAVIVTP